jgi:hypothetical protein
MSRFLPKILWPATNVYLLLFIMGSTQFHRYHKTACIIIIIDTKRLKQTQIHS